jgi:hypothetical protein
MPTTDTPATRKCVGCAHGLVDAALALDLQVMGDYSAIRVAGEFLDMG